MTDKAEGVACGHPICALRRSSGTCVHKQIRRNEGSGLGDSCGKPTPPPPFKAREVDALIASIDRDALMEELRRRYMLDKVNQLAVIADNERTCAGKFSTEKEVQERGALVTLIKRWDDEVLAEFKAVGHPG